MLVLVIFVIVQGQYWAIAWGREVHACARLLVFALVVPVVVMHFVGAIFIVDFLLVLIFRILVTLFESVLTLWHVEVTGLEGLVAALGGTLVVLLVVVLVVAVAATVAAVAILGLVVSMVRMIAFVAAIFVLIVMPCVILQLLLVALLEHVAEFVFCAKLNLPLALLCK